jgi:AraC-like DNA-binding protein
MEYRERAAEPRLGRSQLERWVECVWQVETRQAVPEYPVRPDGCLDLLWSPAAGLQVVGSMTRSASYHLPAGTRMIGVRFRPGLASAVLGFDCSGLTDHLAPLDGLWGRRARILECRLKETPVLEDAVRMMAAALAPPDRAPDPVERALEFTAAAHGAVDLDWLACQAGMSARQFRRRCLEASGLSPKQLCRVLRFRRACALALHGRDWVSIAAEAGYCDQAHLIRDFREFTGGPPMSVFSKTGAVPVGYIGAS